MTGRIFAVGDIHGCLSKIRRLIEIIPVDDREDTLLFIGDYIDRGPDSRGVVDYILSLRKQFSHVVCLCGNHEDMLLAYITEGRDREIYLINGGDATLLSYGLSPSPWDTPTLPDDHMAFFTDLLTFYETPDYIFVHAGLRPGISLSEQSRHDLLWVRDEFIRSSYDFGKTVVFGHTPLREPMLGENKIGIDTGAVYGGPLTCVELPQRTVYQV